MFETNLKKRGHQVQTIEIGTKIAGKLMIFDPEYVVVDINMPGFSGKECIDYLLTVTSGGRVQDTRLKIMVMSSATDLDEDLQHALDENNMVFIAKPIDFDHFFSCIEGTN